MKTSYLLTLLGILNAGFLHADVILDALADTYVERANPDTTRGTNTLLRSTNGEVAGSDIDQDQWAIVRFDISSFTDTLGSATFSIQPYRFTTFEVYGVADGGSDELFNEETYTFNLSTYKSTTADGSLNTGHADLSSLGTFVTDGTNIATFSSSALNTFVENDTNDAITLIVFNTLQEDTDRGLWAEEDATRQGPQLSLITVPEPESLILFALGGLCFIATRRIRL